ncbi:MAG: hypothetical protein ACJAR1_002696, partial [Rubritalea sp.]
PADSVSRTTFFSLFNAGVDAKPSTLLGPAAMCLLVDIAFTSFRHRTFSADPLLDSGLFALRFRRGLDALTSHLLARLYCPSCYEYKC